MHRRSGTSKDSHKSITLRESKLKIDFGSQRSEKVPARSASAKKVLSEKVVMKR